MPMQSRKKLQKKEISAPIPKKYHQYEVSQGSAVSEKHTDWNCPPWPGTRVTISVSYFMTKGPSKEHRTNKPPPTRRVQERSKGDTKFLTTSQNPSCWHPSCLSNEYATMKDESGWWAKDNLETNPITIKPETGSQPPVRAVLLGSLTLLLSARASFPIKSLALSAYVFLRQFFSECKTRIHSWGPRGGPPSYNTLSEKLKSTQLDEDREKKTVCGGCWIYRKNQSICETVKKQKQTHLSFAVAPQIAN